jgi:hypothetical protein
VFTYVQLVEDPAPVELVVVLTGQGKHVLADDAPLADEYLPTGHERHDDDPVAFPNNPGPHEEQLDSPVCVLNVPLQKGKGAVGQQNDGQHPQNTVRYAKHVNVLRTCFAGFIVRAANDHWRRCVCVHKRDRGPH